MGLLKDVLRDIKSYRVHRAIFYFLRPSTWLDNIKYRRQRANRGWSDRDTWNGGEYLMEIASGVLNKLGDEKSHIDWDEYFSSNYDTSFGYKSLNEVAQDLDNYLAWQEKLFSEPIYSQFKGDYETQWAIEYQLHQDAMNAMHFVAENISGLWD